MSLVGSGIDIVGIRRLGRKVSRNSRLLERILTPREIKYCRSKKHYLEHAAGRIALKEAAYKALKSRGITLLWKEMDIRSSGSCPVFSSECVAYKKLAAESIEYSLSISHEREYAVASAVFWRGG